jgi:hypothetical protein
VVHGFALSLTCKLDASDDRERRHLDKDEA